MGTNKSIATVDPDKDKDISGSVRGAVTMNPDDGEEPT
jgi:hypothetical protein